MGFYGKSFIFNDKASDEFELMLYDIDSETQGAGKFASTVSIVEETVGLRWKPYFYGTKFEKKLEFNLVFGVNQNRLDGQRYLDRYELEVIASWLTGHAGYSWLEVNQDDTELVRYKCIVTDLTTVDYGNIPWAFKATITCDSPYAYTYPQVFSYEVSGTQNIQFFNESSHNGFYQPKIEWETQNGGSFSIQNKSDYNRTLSFSNIPSSVRHVYVDNESRVITNDQLINLYPYFNLKFIKLVKGYNSLVVNGTGTLKIICEFPINAGG